jgi:flagellar motility protein MotE (MotC chaperone)
MSGADADGSQKPHSHFFKRLIGRAGEVMAFRRSSKPDSVPEKSEPVAKTAPHTATHTATHEVQTPRDSVDALHAPTPKPPFFDPHDHKTYAGDWSEDAKPFGEEATERDAFAEAEALARHQARNDQLKRQALAALRGVAAQADEPPDVAAKKNHFKLTRRGQVIAFILCFFALSALMRANDFIDMAKDQYANIVNLIDVQGKKAENSKRLAATGEIEAPSIETGLIETGSVDTANGDTAAIETGSALGDRDSKDDNRSDLASIIEGALNSTDRDELWEDENKDEKQAQKQDRHKTSASEFAIGRRQPRSGADAPQNVQARGEAAQILETLRHREAELQAFKERLDTRSAELELAEKRIRHRLDQLETTKDEFAALLATIDAGARRDIEHLIAMYERMKPKQAAPVFNEMDPKIAAGFLGRMRADKASAIMAKMDSLKAYAVTLTLAGRNVRPALRTDENVLPSFAPSIP